MMNSFNARQHRPIANRCWSIFITIVLSCLPFSGLTGQDDAGNQVFRIGMIGLDTSHCPAFIKTLHEDTEITGKFACRVTVAYPYGSRDIKSSSSRIPKFTKQVEQLGVKIVDSIDELLGQVDGVLLETNDGKPHLDQAMQVFRAGKPMFIDKPLAADLTDVVAIFEAAEQFGVPVFSSSSLRYVSKAQGVRDRQHGVVLGCQTYSPCSIEPSHTELFWYGIHGVEILYTCLGTGCQTVRHVSTDAHELAIGTWSEGRVGTFRGLKRGKAGYGGTAFTDQAIVPLGSYEGYRPLVVQIAKFFQTGEVPIDPQETIELYAFMQAAQQSKRAGGKPVAIQAVLRQAEAAAKKRLQQD